MTTPEYYPLSLNALTNACNQKTNREPVVHYEEDEVRVGVEGLRGKGLMIVATSGRVDKYAHRLSDRLNLGNRESAVICVLLLRGPQTLGEIKERSERLHPFDDLEAVESCLRRLAECEPPLAVRLERLPGMREQRYAHLFSGILETPVDSASPAPTPLTARVERLEGDIAALRAELQDLAAAFHDLRRQLE